MSILTDYEQAVLKHEIKDDFLQREVIVEFERLACELSVSGRSWLARIRGQRIKGIYLYGPVGVGKTFLMDLFYKSLNYRYKARFHFHHFMQQVDAKLRQLQGEKNPLQKMATEFAKSVKLLCFDEFMVHDVAHAMILTDLLQALVSRGVVLVITSNTRPEDLYLNGVQRARFLPAIALIKQHCQILYLNEKKDYRLGRETLFEAYLYPAGPKTDQKMNQQFMSIASYVEEKSNITIQNRCIPYIKCSANAIWFDFSVICNSPRSQLDYLEIADRFETVFVSNLPILTEKDTLAVILLIHFVDVMYDRGIRLILSAAVPLEQLYREGEMKAEFKRTLSRLHEMQSADYLKHPPRRRGEHF
ncbi:cell division protein ZapE [Legionella israelensis]|uniref:ATPase n=1 Tax=Legionella israelensis TaxID=454 RepID=A0A0W0W0Q2_9GAMM|nr:cell division protein ZapE [Legionella israelensis]KTD26100.1 ATPase [Legionella israelensis]QBS10113.1 cell division protein ZapE [Legionella israelensis]SCY07943.1 cell division protein ZapE [Legionella israelensis DSM 19235]STX59700.1 ATPase [Legionella israelensis]